MYLSSGEGFNRVNSEIVKILLSCHCFLILLTCVVVLFKNIYSYIRQFTQLLIRPLLVQMVRDSRSS